MRATMIRPALIALAAALGGCPESPPPAGADLSAAVDQAAAADLAGADLVGGGDLAGGASPLMSFFIASEAGSANLGGLAGADARCQRLAATVGLGGKSWAAYLSATAQGGQAAVNARDRIGAGPWYNYAGVKIADSVAALHSDTMNLTKATALDERGRVVNGRGDTPNEHDILTGSTLEGRLSGTATCANWTSEADGAATLGHHDRQGGGANPTSWNSAHDSSGCSAAALRGTGGAGHIYCFAKP